MANQSLSQCKHLAPWIAAALSGLLLVACFPKFHLPGIVWIASVPLLVVLANEKRLKRAFLLAYVCGAVFFAGTCYWFVIVMEYYGHLAPVLAVVVLILFVIVDSVFFGAFGWAMGWSARRSPAWALTASPFLWMGMELARTYMITGFPWNLLGYAVQDSGIREIATATGVYGLSFLAVASSALAAWLALSRRRVRAGMSFAGWLVLLLLAHYELAPPPVMQGKQFAVLIQPNVPLDDAALENWAPWRNPTELNDLVQFSISAVEKFVSQNSTATSETRSSKFEVRNSKFQTRMLPSSMFDSPEFREPPHPQPLSPKGARGVDFRALSDEPAAIHNRKSKIENPPLLVWAENPAPFFFTRDPIFRTAIENMARRTHSIVIGNTIIPVDGRDDEITNSAFVLASDGHQIARYDKIHLVPFGEYVPWWALPGVVHKITNEVGNFVPGSSYSVARTPDAGIGVFICYEAIIPQLARRLVANGANVLVNISNDAWYGDSAAAYQHLEMARLRAIENHRYLLRATNNGLTTLIDPHGRVLAELPRYQRLAMPARFDYETRLTFYSRYGDVFAWLAAIIGAVMLAGAQAWRAARQ